MMEKMQLLQYLEKILSMETAVSTCKSAIFTLEEKAKGLGRKINIPEPNYPDEPVLALPDQGDFAYRESPMPIKIELKQPRMPAPPKEGTLGDSYFFELFLDFRFVKLVLSGILLGI